MGAILRIEYMVVKRRRTKKQDEQVMNLPRLNPCTFYRASHVKISRLACACVFVFQDGLPARRLGKR